MAALGQELIPEEAKDDRCPCSCRPEPRLPDDRTGRLADAAEEPGRLRVRTGPSGSDVVGRVIAANDFIEIRLWTRK